MYILTHFLSVFLSGYGQDNFAGDRGPSGGQGGASGGRDPGNRQGRSASVDISEQIAIALQRLQCDMSSVLVRLNTLEALALSQAQQVGLIIIITGFIDMISVAFHGVFR